eukprot:m.33080 g.33080  ORF g.33080 m.33080 type:complete len:235 (+) comp10854_c0_seq1:5320-6024(+)
MNSRNADGDGLRQFCFLASNNKRLKDVSSVCNRGRNIICLSNRGIPDANHGPFCFHLECRALLLGFSSEGSEICTYPLDDVGHPRLSISSSTPLSFLPLVGLFWSGRCLLSQVCCRRSVADISWPSVLPFINVVSQVNYGPSTSRLYLACPTACLPALPCLSSSSFGQRLLSYVLSLLACMLPELILYPPPFRVSRVSSTPRVCCASSTLRVSSISYTSCLLYPLLLVLHCFDM